MNDRHSFGFAGFLALVALAALWWGGRHYFPELTGFLMKVAGILALLLILFAAWMLFLALHKPKATPEMKKAEEQKAVYAKSRSDLMALRRLVMQTRDAEIKNLCREICDTADRILRTWKEQSEDPAAIRQFLNYYLPTFRSILSKYGRMETGGVLDRELTEHVIKCLGDIKSAMEKMYQNLFEDDKLDLTVEMETLALICKRDGLLDEEGETI